MTEGKNHDFKPKCLLYSFVAIIQEMTQTFLVGLLLILEVRDFFWNIFALYTTVLCSNPSDVESPMVSGFYVKSPMVGVIFMWNRQWSVVLCGIPNGRWVLCWIIDCQCFLCEIVNGQWFLCGIPNGQWFYVESSMVGGFLCGIIMTGRKNPDVRFQVATCPKIYISGMIGKKCHGFLDTFCGVQFKFFGRNNVLREQIQQHYSK